MSSGDSFLATRRKKDVGAPLIETALRNSSMPYDAKGEGRHYSTTQKKDDKVKTARAPASAHLLIDSLDRYTAGYPRGTADPQTTSSQWTLQLPQYVLNGFFTRLAVTQVQFQWNLPTIITGYNDQLVISVVAGISVATIPQGWYSQASLAAAVTTALLAAPTPPGAVVTCNYVPLSENFTLTSASAITMVDTGTNSRGGRFGITSGLQFSGVVGAGTTTVSGAIPTMLPTRFVDIRSVYLAKNQRVKDVTTLPQNLVTDVISRIYAMAPNTTTAGNATTAFQAPWIMNHSFPVPKYIRWNSEEPISNFSLELLDDSGRLLPWAANRACEYALTMIASED